jgi:hypothetical protein
MLLTALLIVVLDALGVILLQLLASHALETEQILLSVAALMASMITMCL